MIDVKWKLKEKYIVAYTQAGSIFGEIEWIQKAPHIDVRRLAKR
jgi:hypothetical protein